MSSSIRRFAKSKFGSFFLLAFIGLIALSFAAGDVQNVLSGNIGQSSGTLASVGSEEITERDMSRTLERELTQLRQQNPEADYSQLVGQYDSILAGLIDQRTLEAFADEHGFVVSPRLIGAEISRIPGARGLNGRFSEQAYQAFLAQLRITDQEVRDEITNLLLQRLLLAPIGTGARVPVGMATPYASMLLESRQGQVAFVPIEPFRAGLNPTDADLQRFWASNRARYMIPEQRVLRYAMIGPEQVADARPTDEEIAAFYRQNQAQFAARDIRDLSQAVAPDRATAEAIARRARAGGTFAAAAAPAGFAPQDLVVGAQTRQQFAATAGAQVAAAAFQAPEGAIVGPIQSDLGWHVVRIDSVRREGGKTLAQARAEIAERLSAEKARAGLEALVEQVQNAIDGGSNLNEAAAAAKLPVTETPLITASGTARGDASYRFPAELALALRSGFELGAEEDPVIETLPNEAGYVVVAPARIVAAAPAPLAAIRDRVAADWTIAQAQQRARTTANNIAAKAQRGVALDKAVAEAGTALPPVRPVTARRLDLTQMGNQVPPPLAMLFTLGSGKARLVADPQGTGYYVVKVNRVIPGNAISQPGLVSRVQRDFEQPFAAELGQQFIAAMRKDVGIERNEDSIEAAKKRLTAGGN